MNENIVQAADREKLLEVKNLRVSYHTMAGEVQSVRGVSFDLYKGETIAVVGESGCGKSVTAKSIMRLIKTPPAEIKEGSEILFEGEDILKFDKKRLHSYRGGESAIISGCACCAESNDDCRKTDYGEYPPSSEGFKKGSKGDGGRVVKKGWYSAAAGSCQSVSA